MRRIDVIAGAVVFLVSCSMQVSAQVTDLIAKCTEIKDVKKRLACFDTIAPIVTSQIYELNAAQRNRESEALAQKKTEVDTLQIEQQKLVRETVREIRKLATATEVGISKIEYSRRVLDVASVVRENLRQITDSSVKTPLEGAMTAYQDANEFWSDMLYWEYVKSFFEKSASSSRLDKYRVYISAYSDINGTFRRLGMKPVLVPVWRDAKDSLERAEVILSQTGK